jgi:hypothetical protein
MRLLTVLSSALELQGSSGDCQMIPYSFSRSTTTAVQLVTKVRSFQLHMHPLQKEAVQDENKEKKEKESFMKSEPIASKHSPRVDEQVDTHICKICFELRTNIGYKTTTMKLCLCSQHRSDYNLHH